MIDVADDDVIAAARVVYPGFVFVEVRRPASEKICSAETAISPVFVRGSDVPPFRYSAGAGSSVCAAGTGSGAGACSSGSGSVTYSPDPRQRATSAGSSVSKSAVGTPLR